MISKSLKSRKKGKLRTKAVDNFVEKKNIRTVFCYKNSIFVSLVVF